MGKSLVLRRPASDSTFLGGLLGVFGTRLRGDTSLLSSLLERFDRETTGGGRSNVMEGTE